MLNVVIVQIIISSSILWLSQCLSSPPQRHQAHWDLFDWSPEANHKQHTVSSPAASPHPTEWLSSVRELFTKTDCVCTLSWRLTSLPWHHHSNNCTNTRLLGVAGTTRCSCESRRLLNHMWVWLKHTHHLMDHSQYSLHNNQPLSALAKCGLFVISANTSIHLNLGLSLVSIQVFTNTSSLSK